jgi:hypothetical protein
MEPLDIKNVTTKIRSQQRRNTINPAMFNQDMYKIDLDLSYLDLQNIQQQRQITINKFAVKSFLKNIYSKNVNE